MKTSLTLRTLIVDDEPLARLNLSSLLDAHADIKIVGQCGDARSAVRALVTLQPQLLFLDVHMPVMDGFAVLERASLHRPPAVVFVTAHDEFAARAFEVQALDYLRKPFRRDRFDHVLDRVRAHLRGATDAGRGTPASDRMVVRSAGRLVVVPFAELDFVRAAANYVQLHMGPVVHEVREPIGSFEQQLPADGFVRIHRSFILHLQALDALMPAGGGEYIARLRSGRELPVGATHAAHLRHALQVLCARVPTGA